MSVREDLMGQSTHPSVPGVREVAHHAGVSRGTVSNVLNYPDRVRPQTRERVLKSIDALGFVPDGNARSLTLGQNNVIGLILPGLLSSFFVDVARGAQKAAQDAGCSLLIATIVSNNDDGAARQSGYMDYFDSTRARGILVAPIRSPIDGVRRAHRRGRPVVTVNFEDEGLDACRVLADEELAGYLAADALLRGGSTRIAWVTGMTDYQPVARRQRGVLQRLAEAGLDLDAEIVDAGGLTATHGETVGRALGERAPEERPDGVVVATAALGASIMRQLLRAGIDVPGDVAIASCEGNTDEIRSDTPLTASETDGVQVGEHAVELLLGESLDEESGHVHRTVVLEPALVRRASTREPVR